MPHCVRRITALVALVALATIPSQAAEALAPRGPIFIGPDGTPLPFRGPDDAADFLRTARIVSDERAPGGVSGARKLLLEQDGVRAQAVFRSQAITKVKAELQSGGFQPYFRDHYANEVAAYRLARAFGLHTVPPTVMRTVSRREGSVQLWVEGAETEKEFRAREHSPVERLKHRMQVELMTVFDALIHNIDRNLGNYLTDSSGRVWWIDHTRSFSRVAWLPRKCHVQRVDVSIWEGLRSLPDERIVEALAPVLRQPEIEGVLERRRVLVDLLSTRLENEGPGAVLFDVAYARPRH